jgi:hypothetical protein
MEDRTDFATALAAINPWMPVDGGTNQACFFCGARRRRDHFAECLWSQAADSAHEQGKPLQYFPADTPTHWYRE